MRHFILSYCAVKIKHLGEARLLRIILWPSLIATWLLGLTLAISTGAFNQGWFQVKFGLVLVLSGYQLWLTGYHQALARGERRLSGKGLRLLNEVPGIAAALIVIMVVLKPF